MTVEDLKNTKIYLSEEAERFKFQDKVFKLGIKWKDGTVEVKYTKNCFYFINNDLQMTMDECSGVHWFLSKRNKQIFLDDVLEIEEPKKEYEFKPFDKVLVRDNTSDRWLPRLYSWNSHEANESYPYEIASGDLYKYCIPYEGNEHLAGTTNSK